MKKTKLAIVLICLFIFSVRENVFSLTLLKQDNRYERIDNYICYYGKGRVKDLAKFDLAVIQAAHYTPWEIDRIKEKGTIVLGYLSAGEDDALHEGDGKGPGGYASWYLDYFYGEGLETLGSDGKPDKNIAWQSYYVNPCDILWQEYVVDIKADFIINKLGCDGLFLDTVLYPAGYPEKVKKENFRPGMIKLIKLLRRRFPKITLVLNNGWMILEELKSKINGILFEDFSCLFEKLPDERLQYNTFLANKVNFSRSFFNTKAFIIFSLDYTDKDNFGLINFSYQRARSFNFIPCVSGKNKAGRYLSVIFMVNPANDLVASRQGEEVCLSWEAFSQYVEESQVEYYIVKRSAKPIVTGEDWQKAFLVNDKIPAWQNNFRDKNVPEEIKYYSLQAIRKGNFPLVGKLVAEVENSESGAKAIIRNHWRK